MLALVVVAVAVVLVVVVVVVALFLVLLVLSLSLLTCYCCLCCYCGCFYCCCCCCCCCHGPGSKKCYTPKNSDLAWQSYWPHPPFPKSIAQGGKAGDRCQCELRPPPGVPEKSLGVCGMLVGSGKQVEKINANFEKRPAETQSKKLNPPKPIRGTVGSRSTMTHLGTCFPAPVSEKNLAAAIERPPSWHKNINKNRSNFCLYLPASPCLCLSLPLPGRALPLPLVSASACLSLPASCIQIFHIYTKAGTQP